MCVGQASAAPPAGVENLERGAGGASRVGAEASVVGAGATVAVGAGGEEAGSCCSSLLFLTTGTLWRKGRWVEAPEILPLSAPVGRQRLLLLLVLCLRAMGAGGRAMGAAARPQRFPSPEAGVQALMEAAQHNDTTTLLHIRGPAAQSLIHTGDPVFERASRARFVRAYAEAHTLVPSGDPQVILHVRQDEWPFPIPLVKGSTGWRFDSEAGKEELLNRNIGRNELAVIQGCLADVDAQREYSRRNPQRVALLDKAKAQRYFGTQMRSVIKHANAASIEDLVRQQFAVAGQISAAGLVPIIEAEVDIRSRTRPRPKRSQSGPPRGTQRTASGAVGHAQAHAPGARRLLRRVRQSSQCRAGGGAVGRVYAGRSQQPPAPESRHGGEFFAGAGRGLTAQRSAATMAAGGVACTGCTGEDYVVPGQNALVLETTDPWEFVSLFRELRANPAQEWALRRAGQATARRFAWPHIVQRILLPRLHHVAETSHYLTSNHIGRPFDDTREKHACA